MTLLIIVFILGYLLVSFEEFTHVDKSVPALMSGGLLWAIYAAQPGHDVGLREHLLHHTGNIGELLFFLLGALTVVELIDAHKGFLIIPKYITTRSKVKLAWIISVIAFFLSAMIDSLAGAIVSIQIMRSLLPKDAPERPWFAALVILAANAGGAWSPIGAVTTVMYYIANKVSAGALVGYLFIPAVVCTLIPLLLFSTKKWMRGTFARVERHDEDVTIRSSGVMLAVGMGALIFVPIFKSLTHLSPFVGMMIAMAVVWAISEWIHPEEKFSEAGVWYSGQKALSRVEMTSITFFMGILFAVAALETAGVLQLLTESLANTIPSRSAISLLLGALSAVVDNVPLAAATISMYQDPLDDPNWHFLAYTVATGGSMLIIGSAAGVAVMALEKISMSWYIKNISWLAAVGYFAGALVYLAMH
ncbi:MAG: sodium:proton antiporter [Saprospiraceae bacterium]|nr:sodium:proton antiporter [Saprospiraceae bacterium]